jgi:aminoglycoside N3'-acetyltransferase
MRSTIKNYKVRRYKSKIINHLKKLKIKKDDHIVLYCKLSSFGIVDKKFPKELLEEIIDYIGSNGTIIMPSYTYENDNFVFDKKKLKVNYSTGILVKYFFMKKNIIRSFRPIHSHLGIGKKSIILKKKNMNSFGKLTDFDSFAKNNFKCVLLGCEPSEGATYFIHLEYMNNVPYRKKIIIKKKVFLNNEIKNVKIKYHNKDKSVNIDLNLGLKKMIKLGLKCEKSSLIYGNSYSIKFRDFQKYGNKLFKQDKYCLID